jgi:hypothetical protein
MAYIKLTNCYKLNFEQIIYVIFIELYMKEDICTALKRNNSCPTYSFRKLDK